MSDHEEEWKPKGRPQSMVAKRFSVALDSLFGLDGTFELEQTVENKKSEVTTQNAELHALEARLKAMESQLKAKGADVKPSSKPANAAAPPRRETISQPSKQPTQQQRALVGKPGAPKPTTVGRPNVDSSSEEDGSEEDEEEDTEEDTEDDSDEEEEDTESEETSSDSDAK